MAPSYRGREQLLTGLPADARMLGKTLSVQENLMELGKGITVAGWVVLRVEWETLQKEVLDGQIR